MLAEVTDILCQNFDNFVPFIENGKGILFSKYQEDVARYAAFFQKRKEQDIILYMPNDLYIFYVCFMACLHAGKDVVLPSFLTNASLDNLGKISSFLITTENLSHLSMDILNPHQIALNEKINLLPIKDRYVSFFTSGSTGTPKQIKKNFMTLVSSVDGHTVQQKNVIDQNPVVVATVQPYHIYGMLWRFLLGLSNGLSQELETVFSPEEIQQKQALYSKIALVTTPTFMNEIVSYKDQYSFKNNCVVIYSSGSLLSAQTSAGMYEVFGVSPFEIFGSTETGGVAWRQQINGPAWCAFANVVIKQEEDSTLSVDSDFCFQRPYQMQDSITMQPDGSFILNGRLDRLVKIAENRISLPEMEEKMLKIPFVRQAYVLPLEAKKGLVLGMLVCLNDEGKNLLCTLAKNEVVYRIKQYLSDWYEKTALPKKFRFINQIPTNSQGKIIKNQVRELFETKQTEPVMNNIKVQPNQVDMDLIFLKDATYFEGHFPNHPILAGVVQVHFAFEFLKRFFDKSPAKYTISKLKFSALILPQVKVHFRMEKLSENEFMFTYDGDDRLYSTAKITIEE